MLTTRLNLSNSKQIGYEHVMIQIDYSDCAVVCVRAWKLKGCHLCATSARTPATRRLAHHAIAKHDCVTKKNDHDDQPRF